MLGWHSFNYDFVPKCFVCCQHNGTLLISFKLRFDLIMLKLRSIALSLDNGVDERCPFLLGAQEKLKDFPFAIVEFELHRIYFLYGLYLCQISFALFLGVLPIHLWCGLNCG